MIFLRFGRMSLYWRLALAFCLVMAGLGAALGAAGYVSAKDHQRRTLQMLNRDLAQYITTHLNLFDAAGPRQTDIEQMFHSLMMVNPSIEAYLLDTEGRVLSRSPPDLRLQRDRVSLEPIQALLAGEPPPLRGDNPRNAAAPEVFSAAPVLSGGVLRGYLYVILLSDGYRELLASTRRADLLSGLAWLVLASLTVAVLIGLGLFALLTRPLNQLTQDIEKFQNDTGLDAVASDSNNEIVRLARAFARLRDRLGRQMAELRRQDHLRRELLANVSHDLRTPMTSMQGYLEALQTMDAGFSNTQKRYLDVAVRQAQRIGRLARQLFELARLEYEETQPQIEAFSMAELLQDIAQKYTLMVDRAQIRLIVECNVNASFVRGDLGLIERAISNLLDNAIRHTPPGGSVTLATRQTSTGLEVHVVDTGRGIDQALIGGLFERNSPIRQLAARRGGGLGLLITHRILTLHGATITADSTLGEGTRFTFVLPLAEAA